MTSLFLKVKVVMMILFAGSLLRNIPNTIFSISIKMHSMAFVTAPDEEVAKKIAQLIIFVEICLLSNFNLITLS